MLLHGVKTWVEKRFTYVFTYTKVVKEDRVQPREELVTETKTRKIFDAIWGCPPCMASVWGSLVYLVHWGLHSPTLEVFYMWPIYVISCAFLNSFFDKAWSRL